MLDDINKIIPKMEKSDSEVIYNNLVNRKENKKNINLFRNKMFYAIVSFVILIAILIPVGINMFDSDGGIFIIDAANDETKITPELTVWSQEYFKNDTVSKEKEIVFENVSYKCLYNKSQIRKWQSYVTDLYKDENGFIFGFKNNTNELVLLNLMNYEFFETEPYKENIDNSDIFAMEYAKKLANNYINVTDYELIIEEPKTDFFTKENVEYSITYYTFTFAKKINNVYSSDFLSVKITSKGNLASLYIGDIGAFNNLNRINFSMKEINSLIADKIQNIYKSKNYVVLEIKIDYQRIVLTPEGKFAIYTAVNVLLKSSENKLNSGVCVLSYLED